MKFSNEHKEVTEFNDKYFNFGIHKVQISAVELGGTGEGEKEYIEITVVDPSDAEITDTARVWFTSDKATNYSFNVLRQIFIHNTPEAKRDEARDLFDKLSGTEELAKIVETLIGKECWFTKYYDPERTYTAQDGSQKRSVNKNIMGYEPKPKPELMPAPKSDTDKVKDAFPGAEEVPFESPGDAAGSIPAKDDWTK